MNSLGLHTGLDMRNQTLDFMQANFGKVGAYYYWISRGVDNREVRANRIRKSVGAENTFSTDLTEFETMVAELQPLIDKVWRHCEDKGSRGRTVTLKVKFNDFEIITRSRIHPRRDIEPRRPGTTIDRTAAERDAPFQAGAAPGGLAFFAAGRRSGRAATGAADLISMETTYILTAELDEDNFAWLDGLRRRHFPPERNFLPAHLSLFHRLSLAQVRRLRFLDVPGAPVELHFDRIVFLGFGVAVHVRSTHLERLRDAMRTTMGGEFPLKIPVESAEKASVGIYDRRSDSRRELIDIAAERQPLGGGPLHHPGERPLGQQIVRIAPADTGVCAHEPALLRLRQRTRSSRLIGIRVLRYTPGP